MSDYDMDVLTWSARRAELLRRIAAGERVGANDLDWSSIIEEIESVGRPELNAVQSKLRQALLHYLKAAAWPHARDAEHRREEAAEFRAEALDSFTLSMRQRIDLEAIYRRVVGQMPDVIEGQPPFPVPPECPVTSDELPGESRRPSCRPGSVRAGSTWLAVGCRADVHAG